MESISVQKLYEQFGHFFLLDVREKWEWDIAHVAGSIHIPLKDIPSRIHELNPTHSIAVMCHHGARSARAVDFLLQHGFTAVYNVSGGIDAWSREIDSSVPLY